MNFLLKGFKELNFGELLAVNGGCSGSCGGFSVYIPKDHGGFIPPVSTAVTLSCSGVSSSRSCGASIISILDGKKIQAALDNNMDKTKSPYVFGKNDCDIWTENVLKQAGLDISTLWGGASSTDVAGHEEKLKNLTSDSASKGWNVVLMTDSDKFTVNHCGILKLESDGSVGFYQNTKSAGGPVFEKYKSINAFQNAYAYKDFDYLKVGI